VSLGMLRDEAPAGAIPSVLVEALVQAVFRNRFEARLHEAMVLRGERPTGRPSEESDEREPGP